MPLPRKPPTRKSFILRKYKLEGGFLGSGKTTAIVNAGQHLVKKNLRVAVITNDQGDQQVDSALVKSIGIPAAEVANGCFCCNYDQLDKHIHSFIRDIQPEIIFAESVGSCTDLVATVAKPFTMAMPGCSVVISVFAEASLLLALMKGHASFIKENVRYIYKKQLEEADVLVVNKTDLVSSEQLDMITGVLKSGFPGKIKLNQSSLDEKDIEKWIQTLHEFPQPAHRSSLEIDYDLYGDGEAQLAWLDKSVIITASKHNAEEIANEIIYHIHKAIKQQGFVIGHLKFFIETADSKKKISITTTSPLTDFLHAENNAGQAHLLINARVQMEPATLEQIVNDTLKQMALTHGCNIMVEKWASFKPGYPKPTHRIS